MSHTGFSGSNATSVCATLELVMEGQEGLPTDRVCVPSVEAVQVLAHGVCPVVAVEDAVRVDEWDELEHKLAAGGGGPWVVLPQQEDQQSVEHVAGRCLTGVHTGRDEEDLRGFEDLSGGLCAR